MLNRLYEGHKMKKEPKARWTAKEESVDEHLGVGITVTIHNLSELGFKYFGEEYISAFDIPIDRYLAMSEDDKRKACEKHVKEILATLTEEQNMHKRAEETAKTLSQQVIAGEIAVSQVKEEKPLKIVDKELLQRIATEAKKLVHESPEMQKVLILKELLTVAKDYGLDENWVSTAVYLLIEEVALKQWLSQHGDNDRNLRNKDYQKLLKMLETDFKKMGRPISPRDLSRFLGERLFRNMVLHEGYNPSPNEAKETKEMAIGLLRLLKSN